MIIGLSGYARSGKDTVAKYLVEEHGFTKLAFADAMREAVYNLNPKITVNNIHGVYLAPIVDKLGWETAKEISPDIRELLQRMGTEVGRRLFGETFWIDQLFKKLESKNVVITDVRFLDEINAIRHWGGEIWRINRPDVGPANQHISETQLDDYDKYDVIINNDSTVEELFSELTTLFKEITLDNVN